MAEISIWSVAIVVMLMMFAASIGFVAAGILAGARSMKHRIYGDTVARSLSTKPNYRLRK
jgi:hypothetical protein